MKKLKSIKRFHPMHRLGLLCALLCLAGTVRAVETDSPIMQIENAWIAEAPPVSKVMAGYMLIHNPGAAALEITRVSSADFSSIEIHRTIHEDGMARMLRQDGINLPAGGSFELKPDGYHLMMFNPKKAFRAGDSSQLVFTLEDGTTASFDIPVKKATGYAHNEHH